MSTFISSIGTAVPKFQIKQENVVQFLCSKMEVSSEEEKFLQRIYRATGIDYRYSVLPDYNMNNRVSTFFPEPSGGAYPSTSERMNLYQKNALPLALAAIDKCFSNSKSLNKE